MSIIQAFLRKFLVALALAGATGAALAAPSYHVSLDTSTFAGAGFLDLYFSRDAGAPQSTVTLSNFSGAFGTQEYVDGDVSGAIPGDVVFGSTDGFNELVQNLTLGGVFGFDVGFSGDFASTASEITSIFRIALFDLNGYLGADGDLLEFALVPMTDTGIAGGVNVSAFSDIAEATVVTAVPEPSALLLMLTGLALAGYSVRRKANRR